MSISSLSRFTVPLASDQSASNQGMLMPKLKAEPLVGHIKAATWLMILSTMDWPPALP